MNQDPGYGQYTAPPGQSRKTHRFRNFVLLPLAALIALLVLIGVISAVAGGGGKVAKTPVVVPSSSQPATSQPASSPADTSQDLTGPVGTTFTVTTQDESGNDVKYNVQAVTITDPARGSDEFNVPASGKRFVGVQFKITGSGGYAHDNANSDALIQGSDGQSYTADFSSLSAGTNFNSGDFGVTSGHSQVGWVAFQLPKGVSVAEIQWQPNSFSDQQPATWTNG